MIEQTLFSLPFAYLGVLFAGGRSIMVWFWVTLALVAARTAGMAFNRIIDAEIDAKNPRTRNRSLPRGEVSPRQAWMVALVSSLLLVAASSMLNRLCFYLSFAALALLFSYSYFKRFTASSHLYLGFVEAAAPVGGYLAVTGRFELLPFILGTAIMMWIAGIDIIYAIQDVDFDRRERLYSLPAKYGRKKSLGVSMVLYALALLALAAAGVLTGKAIAYWVAVACVGVIFCRQQVLSRREDIQGAVKEIFQINAYISIILFIGTFIDVVMKQP